MAVKSVAKKYSETLTIDDFVKFAKECGFKYITDATLYSEDGTEMKTKFDKKKNTKWQELKKKWKES